MKEDIKEAIEDLKLEIKSNEEELPYSKEVLQRNKTLLNYIEQLEKENFELKQRETIHKLEVKPKDNFYEYYDFIPKSRIINKIEELEKELPIVIGGRSQGRTYKYMILFVIKSLKELLGGEQ